MMYVNKFKKSNYSVSQRSSHGPIVAGEENSKISVRKKRMNRNHFDGGG